MDVLKRRMFQAGGSVASSNVLGRGSGFYSAKPGIRRFERDSDGNVFYTTYDIGGNILEEELVDMRLSATGDPEEALAKQRQNKVASALVDAALATPVLKGAQLGTKALMQGSKIARGTRDLLAEAAGLPALAAKKGLEIAAPFKFNPKFVTNPKAGQQKKSFFNKPVMKDGKPVIEPKKTLQQRSIFDPKNYETGGVQIKPLTSSLYGTPVLLEGRSQLLDVITQEPEMAEIIDREVEDDLQAEIDGLQPTPEPTPELTPEPTPEPTPALEEEIEQEQEEGQGQQRAQVAANSLSNFFSSSAFNDALRNIGGSLVREGRFGAGLAAGASAFADEQETKSLLEQERMAKLMEETAKSGKLDLKDTKTLFDTKSELGTHIRDFNNAEAAYELAQSVIDFANKNQNLATFGSKIGATIEDIGAAIGFKEIENVDQLSDTKRAQIALDILANRNIKEILGESGRTISNIDRDIANRIIGNLDITKIQSVPELKKRLSDNIKSIVEKKNDARRKIISSAQFLSQYMPNLFNEDPELLEIMQKDFGAPTGTITKHDLDNLKPRVVKTTLRG